MNQRQEQFQQFGVIIFTMLLCFAFLIVANKVTLDAVENLEQRIFNEQKIQPTESVKGQESYPNST